MKCLSKLIKREWANVQWCGIRIKKMEDLQNIKSQLFNLRMSKDLINFQMQSSLHQALFFLFYSIRNKNFLDMYKKFQVQKHILIENERTLCNYFANGRNFFVILLVSPVYYIHSTKIVS